MIGYLYILLFTVLQQGESATVRHYARRHGSGGMMMNAITALFSALFFLLTDTNGFYAPRGMIPLSVINAFLYATGFYLSFLAYRIGPFGLTKILSGFSMVFTIFYGILFLHEPASFVTYVAIALVFVAMALTGYQKAGDDEKNVSLKWFFAVIGSVVANGFIGVLTKMQQLRFDNTCSNEFQFISIGGSCLLLAALGLILDRDKLPTVLKTGVPYGLLAGLCNGGKNLLTILIYAALPLSIVTPTKSVLGKLASLAMALFIYKERYTKRQIAGVILGVIAAILLML